MTETPQDDAWMLADREPSDAVAPPTAPAASDMPDGDEGAPLTLGALDALLSQRDVTSIFIDGPDHMDVALIDGRRSRSPSGFRNLAHFEDVCRRIAHAGGVDLSAGRPVFEGRLPQGATITILLPPAADRPRMIVRRVPRVTVTGLKQLVDMGALGEVEARTLAAAVRARRSIVVAGHAGVDTAPIAAGLLAEAPESSRVVVVEAAERISCPEHATRLRHDAGVNAGGARYRLGALAQRLGGDVIVFDPLEGGEALAAAHAMAEGRCVIATVTARGAAEALAVFEALALQAGATAQPSRALIAAGLDLIVVCRSQDGGPRVDGVWMVIREGREAMSVRRADFDAVARAAAVKQPKISAGLV